MNDTDRNDLSYLVGLINNELDCQEARREKNIAKLKEFCTHENEKLDAAREELLSFIKANKNLFYRYGETGDYMYNPFYQNSTYDNRLNFRTGFEIIFKKERPSMIPVGVSLNDQTSAELSRNVYIKQCYNQETEEYWVEKQKAIELEEKKHSYLIRVVKQYLNDLHEHLQEMRESVSSAMAKTNVPTVLDSIH